VKEWLDEVVDQIALGEFLANSSISCGQRFGLIAVDNAVEFMLIAYVEVHKQLVGGHKVGGIPKKDWDETKRYFEKLLAFVVAQESALQPKEVEISRYHSFRSKLYHSGTPTTTSATRVNRYSKLAKEVLDTLFNIRFSQNEWNVILARIESLLNKNTAKQAIKRQVSFEVVDDLVRFATSASPIAKEATALCLLAYSTNKAMPPTREELVQSLARSGYPLSPRALNARLHDLKQDGWLQKNNLILSVKGRKKLAGKYLF
jgi:hypothetical protein